MRRIAYVSYWLLLAPLIFVSVLYVLSLPAPLVLAFLWDLFAQVFWEPGASAVRVGLWVFAVFGYAVAGIAVWLLWRRVSSWSPPPPSSSTVLLRTEASSDS